MGLFKGQKSNNVLGLYGHGQATNYMICGVACKKCGRGPGCTKQIGHTTMQGHRSNSGTKDDAGNYGCGHSWDD